MIAVASLFAVVAGCGGGGGGDAPAPAPTPTPTPPPPAAFDTVLVKNCTGLKGQTVDAAAIGTNSTQPGLATSGATVADAVVVDAAAGLPKYCKVTGAIAAASAGAPAINFQVNLPATWNGKALQYGGGGLNGSVVDGLKPLPSAAPTDTLPLARGYITFGSDSGHASPAVTDAAFALNAEALTNFAYAQMKKTKDVAMVLGERLFEQATATTRVYFVGSSEGGREALTVAQRFPDDYAGVIARVPVIQFTGLQLGGNRISKAMRQTGAWLNETKLLLVHNQTTSTCDAQDNLVDGVIGKALSCQADINLIRCPNGVDANNSCLSDAQIAGLNVIHTPLTLGFPLANGNTGYFRYQWGGESPITAGAGGLATWWYGTSAPAPAPGGLGDTLGDAFVKYFIAQDANFDPTTFNPSTYQARIQAVSALVDSDDPAALVAYLNKGGKVIVKEHGADYARSPYATVDYMQRVQTANPTAANNGLRFYLNPSVDHGGIGTQPDSVDLLTQLENWVENNQAPADALTVSQYDSATNAVTKTRLMCRYPAYPRYSGSGDVNSASSFACSTQ
jgi:feruloyl esterase